MRLDAKLGDVADSVPLPTTRMTGLRSRTGAAALGGGSVWVTSTPLAAVLRVDTATKRVSARISVGNEPAGLAVGAGAVWVADSTDNTVSRIVPAGAGAVTDTIPLGNGPGPIAAGESGGLGRQPPRWHGVAHRSRHALGQSRDPGRRAAVRHRGRRRCCVGGEQPVRDGVTHRPAHEPRHADDRARRGPACAHDRRRPPVGHCRGGPAASRALGRPLDRARAPQRRPRDERSRGARRPAAGVGDLRAADDVREPQRLRGGAPGARGRRDTACGVGRRARLHVPGPRRLPLLTAIRPTGHRGRVPACNRARPEPTHEFRWRRVGRRYRRRRGLPRRACPHRHGRVGES